VATSLFNVRLEDELQDGIDARADEEGLKKSTWAREVLGAVVFGEITLEDLHALVQAKGTAGQSVHPDRHLALQGMTGRQDDVVRRCTHPATARKQMVFSVMCSLCGSTVKRT
jgi:hypothetical protein